MPIVLAHFLIMKLVFLSSLLHLSAQVVLRIIERDSSIGVKGIMMTESLDDCHSNEKKDILKSSRLQEE